MSEKIEQIKEHLSPEVYEVVEAAVKLYGHADKIHERYKKLEEVQEHLKKHTIHQWSLRLEANHMNQIEFTEKDVLNPLVWETIMQLLSLLEAIHYSERKAAINQFNNSLKTSNDGKNAS
jgi:hypothetical protein